MAGLIPCSASAVETFRFRERSKLIALEQEVVNRNARTNVALVTGQHQCERCTRRMEGVPSR